MPDPLLKIFYLSVLKELGSGGCFGNAPFVRTLQLYYSTHSLIPSCVTSSW